MSPLPPLTDLQKALIANAAEEMRPQIEAAKPAEPVARTQRDSVGGEPTEEDRRNAYLDHLKMEYEHYFGPARPEDYTLTAQDINRVTLGLTLLANGILQAEPDNKKNLDEWSTISVLQRKFQRGFETVIRDVQP
jgi:hypothetical protein